MTILKKQLAILKTNALLVAVTVKRINLITKTLR